MKKNLVLLIAFLTIFSSLRLSADYVSWDGAIKSFQGAIDSRRAVEVLLEQIQEHNLKPGDSITTTRNGVERKIRYTKKDVNYLGKQYRYFVEVWVMHDSGDGQGTRFQKAVEMVFNNGYQGVVIIRGAVLNETYAGDPLYEQKEEGHWCRITFNHRNSIERDMEIDFIRVQPTKAARGRYKVSSDSQNVYLYMTAIMPADHASFPGYPYLLGSIMSKSGNYNTIARFGVVDTDDALNFLFPNGINNPYNTGKFDVNGFISDGYTGGDASFPDPALFNPAHLPTKTEVNAFSISFIGELDLDF